ncbi:MAG: hypothetical protein AVDCRST_MAG28-2048 [uncultured Rubrobacteraceae bacterium]|uniref:DUF998 domain-containing protein n=1 Tax=uncultured Rubrobacteraceae bacterium TaxID=349277 RepID=A0A6J4QS34_9ACTN|nr:MAG: hypothetical protein AVDCRST_MAG28-2048 [uncultured Rubrobacteraceae bacterium]
MMGKSKQLRLAGTLAIITYVYWLVTVVTLPVVTADEYDPIKQGISALAVGRFGMLMDVAFFAFAIGSLALAFGMYRSVDAALDAPLLLAVTSVLWFLLGIFHTGPGGTEAVIHSIVALTSFLLILIVMFLFARRFRGDARWRSFALPTLVWAIVAVGALLSIPLLGDELFGVSERIFVTVFVSWLLVTAIQLRSLAA